MSRWPKAMARKEREFIDAAKPYRSQGARTPDLEVNSLTL